MTNAITVLIVDDHEVVREGVRAYLEAQSDIDVVGDQAALPEAHIAEGSGIVRNPRRDPLCPRHAACVQLHDDLVPDLGANNRPALIPVAQVAVQQDLHGVLS